MKGFSLLATSILVSIIVLTISILGLANNELASTKPHLTCKSGKTLFHKGSIRAFVVTRTFVDTSGQGPNSPYETFYVCRPGARNAKTIFVCDPFVNVTAYGFRLFGNRLGFVIHSEGFDNGSDTQVGWLDTRIGQLRIADINTGENSNPGDP